MKVKELVEKLQALTPEQQELEICHDCEDRGFCELDEPKEFDKDIRITKGFMPMKTVGFEHLHIIYV